MAKGSVPHDEVLDPATTTLEAEFEKRKRAECMAHMQSYTVKLALDLLVREPDLDGFFRGFIRTLIEEGESDACGVFLLDEDAEGCDLTMAYVGDRFYTRDEPDWDTLTLPRGGMSAHLLAYTPGWSGTIEYDGMDARLPESVRTFNETAGLRWFGVTPLADCWSRRKPASRPLLMRRMIRRCKSLPELTTRRRPSLALRATRAG